MQAIEATMKVRQASAQVSIIDISGELTIAGEKLLMDAYHQASSPTTRAIILSFNSLEYMNSSGIGLLVTLLIRVNRQQRRLLSCGLSEHYRHIFELTRLSDAIRICDSEDEAVAAAGRPDRTGHAVPAPRSPAGDWVSRPAP